MQSIQGNQYTKFIIGDITFRFSCGDSNLNKNFLKIQNIMTSIVDKLTHLHPCPELIN